MLMILKENILPTIFLHSMLDDVINQNEDHDKDVHPSNLSEVVENERIDKTLNNVIIKKADKMSNQVWVVSY